MQSHVAQLKEIIESSRLEKTVKIINVHTQGLTRGTASPSPTHTLYSEPLPAFCQPRVKDEAQLAVLWGTSELRAHEAERFLHPSPLSRAGCLRAAHQKVPTA